MRPRYSSRQSKTFAAKQRTRLVMRWSIGVVSVVLAVMLVSAVSSMSFLTITNVQVAGIDQYEVAAIHQATMNALSGSYLGLFSRSNSYVYPRASIRDTVSAEYPEAQSVEVARADRHTLIVSIHEKDPAAVVCATLPDFDGDHVSVTDSGACYFTDDVGILFKRAPSFSGAVYKRYYIPDLALNNDATSSALIGSLATSTKEFRIIQGVYDALQHADMTVDAMLMKSGGEYEVYVRNPGVSSSTAVIYFNTIAPVDEQIANLISFWNHTIEVARAKKEQIEFDYIDVRYSPNVYHRFVR
jgi:hypothetical protein